MAVGILVMLYVKHPVLPNSGTDYRIRTLMLLNYPFSRLCLSHIACGAISGFHATAKSVNGSLYDEERLVALCSMVLWLPKVLLPLIWAAAAISFFPWKRNGETRCYRSSRYYHQKVGSGTVGGFACYIRCDCRAYHEWWHPLFPLCPPYCGGLHSEWNKNPCVVVCIYMYSLCFSLLSVLLLYSLSDKEGFDMIWRYFAWTNQTLSVFTLWAITVYLVREKERALLLCNLCSGCIYDNCLYNIHLYSPKALA